MAFASNKAVLPDELEQLVFLLASRKPRELATYMRVARHVKRWMEPILYKKINISSRARAENLSFSLTTRSKTVLSLHIGTSVPPSTVATLLRRHCPRLINFAIYGGGDRLYRFHAILNTLNDLTYLRYLSVDPALLFQTRFVHLPDTPTFHCVTHLDLTTDLPWEAVVSGFQYLDRLTHLSMTWKMTRCIATHSLVTFLQRQKSKLIVLWLDGFDGQPVVIENLIKRRLDDPRIVLLRRERKRSMELSGSFWLHAKRIVTWRKENNITTVQHPSIDSEDLP